MNYDSELTVDVTTTGLGTGTKNLKVELYNRDILAFGHKMALKLDSLGETVKFDMSDPRIKIKESFPNGGVMILRISDDANTPILERLLFLRPSKNSI